jgi:hypothetical protein
MATRLSARSPWTAPPATSVVALGGLIVSYGNGLFGWQEVGFATAIELVLIFEVAAVILLSAALAAPAVLRRRVAD